MTRVTKTAKTLTKILAPGASTLFTFLEKPDSSDGFESALYDIKFKLSVVIDSAKALAWYTGITHYLSQ